MYQSGQGHSGDGADELHGGAVVDVAVFHRKLLTLTLIVIHCTQIKIQASNSNMTRTRLEHNSNMIGYQW